MALPQLDLDDITLCINKSAKQASNEEEVRIGVSRCIEDKILRPLGITQVGRYEYTLISGARVDALYGHVIIEYKAPGKLSSDREIQKAKEQVIKYITDEAKNKSAWSRYLGVIISDRIAFVRYDQMHDTWILRGPYDIRRETVIKLVEALRGLKRKKLDAETLIKDFGPQSDIAKKAVKTLYLKLVKSLKHNTCQLDNEFNESLLSKVELLFCDWMRLFKQATGYDPDELEELPELAKEYGIGEANYDALMFAIHTYYALILKLIAAEIVYLYGGGKLYRSYIAELDNAYSTGGVNALRQALEELESGGIFKNLLSIENFLEGDYFSWYLEELDQTLADVIAEIARALENYEIATPQLEPEFARDLLKRLYQDLIPEGIRHNLGEYYTPDWLADFLLDEVGLGLDNLRKMGEESPLKPLELRVLDPSCGSGTFLVRYISRLRRYAEEHYLTDQLVNYVLQNVVGYDLNPLAVLTARTNYLLAIADLLGYKKGRIEIPVYLSDSIMVQRSTQLTGSVYVLKTVAGDFRIPASIVDSGRLQEVLGEMEDALRSRYNPEEFRKRIEYRLKLGKNDLFALKDLYETLYKLENEGKDDVWIAILRNAFAPILKGKFDYVVGNPPWVNWENLPDEYRELSRDLWEKYGLTEIKGKGPGKAKRDLAMLFLTRSFDQYLKPGGKLGFLLPFTVFKTQAGAGFRKFLATKTKILVIHDMVALKPFEKAENRTAAIVVEKTEANKNDQMGFIRYVIWHKDREEIPEDLALEDVLKITRRYEIGMAPIDPKDRSSTWVQATPKSLPAIRRVFSGPKYLEAHEGVDTALNQVYFVKILERRQDGTLVITNPPKSGHKKEVKQVEAVVESDLVYPLIVGRDVKKWYVKFADRYIILPYDPSTGKPIPQNELKIRYPRTYSYFYQFKDKLMSRSISKKQLKSIINESFYAVTDIGSYTFAPYKVVWKEVSARQQIKGFHTCVVEGSRIVPDHTVVFIPLYDRDEAYYISAVLNSSIFATIFSYAVVESIKNVGIPKFNKNNLLHQRLLELSKEAHRLARCIHEGRASDECPDNPEGKLKHIEEEIDRAVTQLFGISEEELREMRKLLAILSGEEVEDTGEEPLPDRPVVSIRNTLLKPYEASHLEVEVVNPKGVPLQVEYDFPWGKGSFEAVSGAYRVDVPPLEPGKYEGVVTWKWSGGEERLNVTVEVSEVSGPKRKFNFDLE